MVSTNPPKKLYPPLREIISPLAWKKRQERWANIKAERNVIVNKRGQKVWMETDPNHKPRLKAIGQQLRVHDACSSIAGRPHHYCRDAIMGSRGKHRPPQNSKLHVDQREKAMRRNTPPSSPRSQQKFGPTYKTTQTTTDLLTRPATNPPPLFTQRDSCRYPRRSSCYLLCRHRRCPQPSAECWSQRVNWF